MSETKNYCGFQGVPNSMKSTVIFFFYYTADLLFVSRQQGVGVKPGVPRDAGILTLLRV